MQGGEGRAAQAAVSLPATLSSCSPASCRSDLKATQVIYDWQEVQQRTRCRAKNNGATHDDSTGLPPARLATVEFQSLARVTRRQFPSSSSEELPARRESSLSSAASSVRSWLISVRAAKAAVLDVNPGSIEKGLDGEGPRSKWNLPCRWTDAGPVLRASLAWQRPVPRLRAAMSTANRSIGGVEAAQLSLVFVTVPTKEVAHSIARNLVESKLAACVNIIPGTQLCLESVYVWQGKVATDAELLLKIKTRRALVAQLAAAVKELHPYDECEVTAVDVTGGSDSYLDWCALRPLLRFKVMSQPRNELRALLNELSRQASSSLTDEDASWRLATRATDWSNATVALRRGGRLVLSSSDLQLAGEQLDRIAGRLSAAWAALPPLAGIVQVRVWRLRFSAASALAESCATVIRSGGHPPATVLAFSRCVTLLLGPGRLLLDNFAADSGATGVELSLASNVLDAQLRLMYVLLMSAAQCGVALRDDWTTQLAPSTVVAWLETAAAAAARLPPPSSSQTAEEQAKVMGWLASVVFFFAIATNCSSYAAAIALSGSLPANLVTVLVPAIHQAAVVLRLPPERRSQWDWCTWRCAADMAGVLTLNELACALYAHLCPPAQLHDDGSGAAAVSSNAQRLLATACQLMAHVPLDLANKPPSSLGMTLCDFAMLLGSACSHIRALLGPLLAGHLEAEFHNRQAGAQYHRMAQQLLQVLPRLPATLQLLVEGGPLRNEAACVGALCSGWKQAIVLLRDLVWFPAPANSPTIVSSWSELAAWCTACAALLKGRALTAALVGQYDSLPAEQNVLLQLEEMLCDSTCLIVAAAGFAEQQHIFGIGAPLPAATVAAAETGLWELHSALCRSAHRQTAGDVYHSWDRNLDSTNQTLLAAWRLHCCAQRDVSQPFGRHSSAMAAAHCQMLQAVVCDAGRSETVLQLQLGHAQHVASAIAVCGAMCPAVLVLYPALLDLQRRALMVVDGENSELSDKWIGMMLCIAQAAAASPHVTAHMLASGAMETMLQQLERSSAQEAALLGAQGGVVARLLADAYQALVHTADDVLAAASSGSTAVRTEELQAAQQSLKAVLSSLIADLGVAAGGQPRVSAAAAAKMLREEAQPAAGQLASALLVLWTGPEQRKQAALELAQASAARSCAYLSCSNVCGEGGPAPGQGVGSKRCSQCHTAYYCGTACSHADWRQGRHGRVCKALAGARQADQQEESG
ncbi:hypothetical protein ACK3TF_004043 [Chlorella vulgaris]